MRIDLPPVLRLLTPREPMPDVQVHLSPAHGRSALVHDFVAFCRVMLDRGEPMPSYAWVDRALRQELPPRVLFADPAEQARMDELETALGVLPVLYPAKENA